MLPLAAVHRERRVIHVVLVFQELVSITRIATIPKYVTDSTDFANRHVLKIVALRVRFVPPYSIDRYVNVYRVTAGIHIPVAAFMFNNQMNVLLIPTALVLSAV